MREEEHKRTNTIITSLLAVVLIYFLFAPVHLRALGKFLPIQVQVKCRPILDIYAAPVMLLIEHCPPYVWLWETEVQLFGLPK